MFGGATLNILNPESTQCPWRGCCQIWARFARHQDVRRL